MKKTVKLIPLGVLLALSLPLAAHASVEVYGKARVAVEFANNGDDNTGQEKSKMSLANHASRLGFKGDEDLGGDLSAFWQIETSVSFDTGTAFSSPRQTFVGLAGGFGTVLAGRLDTPFKSATNGWDPFVDTAADYNAILYGRRVPNTLAYVSPNMNGFKAAAAWALSDQATGSDSLPITKTANKQDAYSVSANYDNGPLGVAAAYEVLNKLGATNTSGTGKDDNTAMKVGAKYTIMDATTLALVFENQDMGGNVKDRNIIYFAASHKIGDTTLKLAYTNADKCGGTASNCDKTGANQISVGVAQSLTKNTEIYALYSQISNDDNVGYGLIDGPGAVVKSSGVASDPSVISIGFNHNFSSK